VILAENLEAAGTISQADLNKRQSAWKEKKEKLKNPNFFISTTRLSIRNIPVTVDEKEIVSLFIEEVKPRAKDLGIASTKNALIKQIKIIRDPGRLDSKKVPRSKGYGFIEFKDPEIALTALRAVNNNPKYFSDSKRLIVEFALENSQALLKFKKSVEMSQKKLDKNVVDKKQILHGKEKIKQKKTA